MGRRKKNRVYNFQKVPKVDIRTFFPTSMKDEPIEVEPLEPSTPDVPIKKRKHISPSPDVELLENDPPPASPACSSSSDGAGWVTPPEDNCPPVAKTCKRVYFEDDTSRSSRTIESSSVSNRPGPLRQTRLPFKAPVRMDPDMEKECIRMALNTTTTVDLLRIDPVEECKLLDLIYGGVVDQISLETDSENDDDDPEDPDAGSDGDAENGTLTTGGGKRQTMHEKKRKSQDFEVERILDVKWFKYGRKQIKKYLVKWRWWDETNNSWQSEADMAGCQLMVSEFHAVAETPRYRKRYDLLLEFRNSLEEMMDRDFDDFGLLVKFWRLSVQWTPYSRTKLKTLKNKISDDFAYLWDYGDDIRRVLNELFPKAIKQARLARSFLDRKLTDEEKENWNSKKFTDIHAEAVGEYLKFYHDRWESQERTKDYAEFINSRQQEKWALAPAIVVQNYVDLEYLTKERLDFVPNRVPSEDIVIPSDPAAYCSCGPDGECDEATCTCFMESNNGNLSYDEKGLLKRGNQYNTNVIYECNAKCSCRLECKNRVTQKAPQVKLAIFKTENGRGWGVKTLERIPRGVFVFEYTGEVITEELASDRGQVARCDGIDYNYFFDLDFAGPNEFVVDAGKMGNISHFVNHSCDPNLESMNVLRDCQDPRLPHIMFFSRREIKALEEMTFDYKMHVPENMENESEDEVEPPVKIVKKKSKPIPVRRSESVTSSSSSSGDSSDEASAKKDENDSGLEDGSVSDGRGPSRDSQDQDRSVAIVQTNSVSGPPPGSIGGSGDSPDIDPDLLHDLLIRRLAPPIKRIKCLCGSPICRGYLF